jgi:hypothetical protein
MCIENMCRFDMLVEFCISFVTYFAYLPSPIVLIIKYLSSRILLVEAFICSSNSFALSYPSASSGSW